MTTRRAMACVAILLGGLLPWPSDAEAQVAIRVDWHAGGDNVRVAGTWTNAPRVRYGGYPGVIPVRRVSFRPVRGVRVPPGHRPPRGACRLWYPGLPPGQQPAPVPCTAMRGAFHPDVVVVTWRGVVAPVPSGPVAFPEAYAHPRGPVRWRHDRRDRWGGRHADGWWYDDDRYDDGWWGDDDWDDDGYDDDHDRDEVRRRGPPVRGRGGPPGRGRGRGRGGG